jgi:hypothetical protein
MEDLHKQLRESLSYYFFNSEEEDNILPDNDIIHTIKVFDNIDDAEDEIFFVAKKIEIKNNIIKIDAKLGYGYDPTTIRLIYNTTTNEIIINSSYRMLHSPIDNELFRDTFIFTKTHPQCELMDKDDKSIPYYRFPRSKDGIPIPQTIIGIFKVFENENSVKPSILIPSEWYAYNPQKFIENINEY